MVTKRVQKGFVSFAIVAFFAVGVLGLTYGMPTDSSGQMSNCPFLGVTTVLATFLLLALFVVAFLKNIWNSKKLELVPVFSQRFREKTFIVRSPLQELFSNGILHPKIF